MVRAGGEGGFLEEALARVAEFTEAQDDLREAHRRRGRLPGLPGRGGHDRGRRAGGLLRAEVQRAVRAAAREGELPLLTEWLLATSDWLRRWGLLAAGGLGGGRVVGAPLAADRRRPLVVRPRQAGLPLAGPIFLGLAVARFCRVLGTLLHNGVPILRSLQISRDATGNRVLAAAIGEATENISAGQSLAGPLAASGRFPPAVVEMIAVAEQANNLESVLLGVASSVDAAPGGKLDLAVRLMEPILLALWPAWS